MIASLVSTEDFRPGGSVSSSGVEGADKGAAFPVAVPLSKTVVSAVRAAVLVPCPPSGGNVAWTPVAGSHALFMKGQDGSSFG